MKIEKAVFLVASLGARCITATNAMIYKNGADLPICSRGRDCQEYL